ncbi:MAG: D-alanyl-D-alanine carboxypeptidase/D-alanyl-D-alanine-endopeptidase [Prochlorococcaceae cyanobacterium]
MGRPSLAWLLGRAVAVAACAPVPMAWAQPPMAPPPAVAPAVASLLQARVSCPALQRRLEAAVGAEASVWSVTVVDGRGQLLADVNGQRPRVPASNQKLISTAFALDRLGPDHRLSTRLWLLPDGRLRLTGQGDPDLDLPRLQRIAQRALAQARGTTVRLELAEVPASSWWPEGWNPADRSQHYGAPITRLAVTSNEVGVAVSNPPSRLQRLLASAASQQGGSVQLSLVSASAPLPTGAQLIHEEPSVPMLGLLGFANTDSHNFTAEVLLREAAGTWDLQDARRQATAWLSQQGVPMEGVRIADGSGLDRANRLTSRALAALLLRMDQHPQARLYADSMAIAGRRGTLRNLYVNTSLAGQFRGKTGTLTGVRSITGVLSTADGPRYVSALSNGASAPNVTIGTILRSAQDPSLCSNLSASAGW